MKALTLWQPWASLVAVGAKTIETRSWSTEYRGPLAIHAAQAVVGTVPGQRLGRYQEGDLHGVTVLWDVEATLPDGREDPRPLLLPRGVLVATCTLTDVVPIVRSSDDAPESGRYVHDFPGVLDGPSSLWLCRRDKRGTDCLWAEKQRPFGNFEPGRYAWLLDDIEPTTERCPACEGTGGKGWTGDVHSGMPWEPCPLCWPRDEAGTFRSLRPDDEPPLFGRCPPVPARGRQGLWNWEPA